MEAEKPKYRKVFLALSIGYYLVGSIVGGLITGYFLDKWLNTEPVFLLTLLIIGIGYGLYMTIRISLEIIK